MLWGSILTGQIINYSFIETSCAEQTFSHPWLGWLYCSAILAEVEKIYQEGQVLVIGTRYSFGVEKTNMFIRFRCFLENHTQSGRSKFVLVY